MTDKKIIVVTGCRDWDDDQTVEICLIKECQDRQLTIFTGGCPTGADYIAHRVAVYWDITNVEVYADWDKHGRSAGPRRNGEMLRMAKSMADSDEDTELECLAFWDGKSRGTLDCLTQATKMGIPVRIVPRAK